MAESIGCTLAVRRPTRPARRLCPWYASAVRTWASRAGRSLNAEAWVNVPWRWQLPLTLDLPVSTLCSPGSRAEFPW